MTLYNVNLYTIVRVRLDNIEAQSQSAAIEAALKTFDGHALRCSYYGEGDVDDQNVEYAEEITEALVDEVGDDQYANSTWHRLDGWRKPLPAGFWRRCRQLVKELFQCNS